jgi:glycosyltransferase involved in cell wall biosynthesis
MKHIVIDARIINSTTGRYIERLLTYLEKLDTKHRYTVLVPTKDLDYWRPSNPRFTITAADFANYSLDEQIGFRTFLNNLSPDLVHFCMPQQPILYTGNHVTTVHDLTLLKTYSSDKNWLTYHLKQLVGKYVFRRIARTSSHIITPSNYVKEAYAAYARIPLQKITVTYEAADGATTASSPVQLPFDTFLLYVGAQNDYKNIPALTAAHQKLLEVYPKLGLVLVGKKSAMHTKNEQLFRHRGYKNIHYTGFVSDEQLSWLYKHCAAYVFPSLSEGFGLPGLEAMAHGAPVASSEASCLPEVLGDAAVYFDPRDTNDIAQAIRSVIEDASLRRILIKKGFTQAKEYSWERMATQTLAVYKNALKTPKS